jgi:hypothetical protein
MKLLGAELYGSPTHFVLELLQNASDNKYASGTNPTLHMKLQGNLLVIRSNEEGFSRQNVDAICTMGGSSKDKHDGCIGEKGTRCTPPTLLTPC